MIGVNGPSAGQTDGRIGLYCLRFMVVYRIRSGSGMKEGTGKKESQCFFFVWLSCGWKVQPSYRFCNILWADRLSLFFSPLFFSPWSAASMSDRALWELAFRVAPCAMPCYKIGSSVSEWKKRQKERKESTARREGKTGETSACYICNTVSLRITSIPQDDTIWWVLNFYCHFDAQKALFTP